MTCRLLALVLVVALTLLIASAWAQQPTKIPAVDVLVTHAAASDSTSATRKYQPHPWMAGFGRLLTVEGKKASMLSIEITSR